MKACPVCNAATFDDALVCYGCLYRYEEGNAPEAVDARTEGASDEACVSDEMRISSGARTLPHILPDAPSFLIRMVPILEQSGGYAWQCSVTCENK